MIQKLVWRLFYILILGNIFSVQAQKKLNIEHADQLIYLEQGAIKLRKLIGHVKLRQKDVVMTCDSAYFYAEENKVDAFGNVHISQNDTMNIYSNVLNYDGKSRQAILRENVKLVKKDLTLETQKLDYDAKEKIAVYNTGAVISKEKNVLTSVKGTYYSKTEDIYFKDSVKLKGEKMNLESDTLRYNVASNLAYFFQETHIYDSSSHVLCNRGVYNVKTNIGSFQNRVQVENTDRLLIADSIWYNEPASIAYAFGDVYSNDTASKIIINCQQAYFNDASTYVMVTDTPIVTFYEDDTLHLGADTIVMKEDSSGLDVFYAYYHTLLYSKEMQAKCDSLHYSEIDSTMRLFNEPVVWSDGGQMTADSISVIYQQSKIKQVNMIGSSFMVNNSHEEILFDQVKGKNIYSYFKEGALDRLWVRGNAQSIYYAKDDSSLYLGVNKVECSDMWMYFVEDEIERIKFLKSPESIFHPIATIKPENFMLENFKWLEDKRPKAREDLKRRVTDPQEVLKE